MVFIISSDSAFAKKKYVSGYKYPSYFFASDTNLDALKSDNDFNRINAVS